MGACDLVSRRRDLLELASPAHVALGSPLVEELRSAGSFELQPKQAWTNVADFAARGLDAVNLAPAGRAMPTRSTSASRSR